MENCHPEETTVDRGEAEVDSEAEVESGFLGVTISNITLSWSQ